MAVEVGAAGNASTCPAIVQGSGASCAEPRRRPRNRSRIGGRRKENQANAHCMNKTRPIIIIKKKAGHGGHHGGAWKVAYADFVTAMMALFIVLWLMNTSKQMQEAVGGYFKDPSGTSKKSAPTMAGSGENFTLTKENMPKLKDQLNRAIRQMKDFEKLKSHIEMTVTAEGLRIELLESASGTFFDSGSPELNATARNLLITLAQELGKLPNKLSIEGHTDSKPYAASGITGTGNFPAIVPTPRAG